jgi:hypothetical protein
MEEPLALRRRQLETGDVDKNRAARTGDHGEAMLRAAASRISAFICRTASRSPTNTERETIAWPI